MTRRYLIVDDNEELAENLADILRDDGAEVVVASGGAQALLRLEDARFNAIITDMRMPAMDGARLIREARRIDPGLAALVLTAYTGDEELALARKEGLLAVLPKPVPVARLLSLLGSARRDALVVIVEDDLMLSDNLEQMLQEHGFATLTAHSLEEAQRFGRVEPFAAIVDLRVPDGPSGEAARSLRKTFPNLPLIVMTGWEEELPEVSADAVLSKPFVSSQLLAHLKRLHETRSAA